MFNYFKKIYFLLFIIIIILKKKIRILHYVLNLIWPATGVNITYKLYFLIYDFFITVFFKFLSRMLKNYCYLDFSNIIIYQTNKQFWMIHNTPYFKKRISEIHFNKLKKKFLIINFKDSSLITKKTPFNVLEKKIECFIKSKKKIILPIENHPSENYKLIHDDCFSCLKKFEPNTVDAVISDLPYNTSNNLWDIAIDLSKFWEIILRVLKKNGIIILTASSKFASKLIESNLKMYKYDLIWVKSIGSNQLNINHQPLRMHEQILIFYNKLKTYNEQLTFNHKPYKITRQITKQQGFGKQKMHFKSNSGFRHAKSILNIPNPRTKNGHPTEKPVKLLEYLIKTYTNKNDVILDPFMGCGSTGIACKNLDRKFIGIEKELNYYKSAAIKINGVNVE